MAEALMPAEAVLPHARATLEPAEATAAHTEQQGIEHEKREIDEKRGGHVDDHDEVGRSSDDSQPAATYNNPTIDEDPDKPYPTEEELATLRVVADRIPVSAFLVAAVECAERFAYYGLSGPFINYIQRPIPAGGRPSGAPSPQGPGTQAGALNQGQSAATGLYNMFSFLAYLTPIAGAIIADAKLGRYWTIVIFSGVYLIGLLIVTLTAIPSALTAGAGLPGWIVGAIIVAIGTGGIKSNVSPLIAEQYTETKMYVKTLPSGERVIVSPFVTITRIYNLFYWCINIGGIGAIATTESELHVGFWLAYLLPTAVFVMVPVLLAVGYKYYKKNPPRGSVFLEATRVLKIAFRGFWRNPIKFIKENRGSGVLERAKPSVIVQEQPEKSGNPTWLTWDDAFVDELKRTLKACQVFLFFPFYWLTYNQLNSNLISQAGQMTTNGVPNDLLNNLDPIALVIFIPITDFLLYPTLRRFKIQFRPIAKITLGFFLGSLSMVYAAVLQNSIYNSSPAGKFADEDSVATINVWVQVPAYVLIAFSEIFASITGYEYAYNKAPQRMKSLVTAIFLLMTAFGNALNAALSGVSTNPYLVWMYTGVACTAFVAGILFYICFRHLDATEETDNQIGKGRSMSDEALADRTIDDETQTGEKNRKTE